MFSVDMSTAFNAAATLIAESAVKKAIDLLSVKYGFDATEASEFVLSGGIETKKQLIPLKDMPWSGKVRDEDCKAIALNNGLYTQCPMKPVNGKYCKKCFAHVEVHGTPRNGDVEARLACDPLKYSVKGRQVVTYRGYMKKHHLTQQDVEEAAAEYGLTIDPRQYEEGKRGRPNTNREMVSVPIPVPDPVPDPDPDPLPEPLPDGIPEGLEDTDDEAELTYTEVMSMTMSDIRDLAGKHDIDVKQDGKFIKISELRKQVLAKLGLSA